MTSARRCCSSRPTAEPLLGGPEALHGKDRGRPAGHRCSAPGPGSRRSSSTTAPTRLRARRVVHQGRGRERLEIRPAAARDRPASTTIAVDHALVQRGHAGGRGGPADRPHELLGRALDDLAGDQRADRDHRRRRGRRSPRACPGTARIGPIRSRGWRGRRRSASAASIASRTSGVGRRGRDPANLDRLDSGRGAVEDQVLLEPRASRRGSGPGCGPAARTSAAPRAAHPERARDLRLGGGAAAALGEEVVPVEAGGEVAVGEREPVRRAELRRVARRPRRSRPRSPSRAPRRSRRRASR